MIYGRVSILILLEVILEVHLQGQAEQKQKVSILILLEVILEDIAQRSS
mgnify:CR=1 FL=1